MLSKLGALISLIGYIMKKLVLFLSSFLLLGMAAVSAVFAAVVEETTFPSLNANSLVICREATTLSAAVSDLNGSLASSALATWHDSGSLLKIDNFSASEPVITNLNNGQIAVCVTIKRKGF